MDHRFERGLTDVSATYALRADGGVDVTNRGFDTAAGVWREARGRAYFSGPRDRGSLKVSFWGPFYGGYHIMALDPAYQWALVTGPTRRYLWILARETTLPEAVKEKLVQTAAAAGYETDGLIWVSHDRREPPGVLPAEPD